MAVRGFDPDSWRLMLAKEHMCAVGFFMYPELGSDFGVSPLLSILPQKPEHIKKLIGNGMHLVTQCAWMMYVLGHCVRANQMPLRPVCVSTDPEDVEDLEM